MPSAVLFLPCHIMELTNFVTRSDPYTGSGSTFRLAMYPFRGISASSSWLLAVSSQLSALSPIFSLQNSWPLFGRRLKSDDRRLPYALGRLAPYFERLCLRPATPTASRVPRIT